MNLALFAITPPETISAHTRAVIASGALLLPASVLRMKTNPGSVILCPACFLENHLEPIWNSDGRSMIGFNCICGHSFDSSQALHLVFGHLTL